ncbi:MAG: transketolase [Chloroflexota bacterium]|jgi:transketolase|nr:transketolase [Chloroflexota bacterium]
MSSSAVRRTILEQARRAHVGHIGSALSIADLAWALCSRVLAGAGVEDPDRDRFVLSKGHAALAWYAAMNAAGGLPDDLLDTYCGDGSLAGVHPQHAMPGIDFTTGSLGHGLPIGAGAALAARLQSSSRRTFVLMSDAECNEGSVWEAMSFAAHHNLSSLTALIDVNGQQALGYTRDVLDTAPLAERWRGFGWDVHEVDGHNVEAITTTIGGLDMDRGRPHVLVAQTTFGKGVSFMENQIKWHYSPMSDSEFATAMAEVAAAP